MISFGSYELIERLATGGMGEVFLAKLKKEEGFEKVVAIKRILPHLSLDPSFVALFNREACIAAQLNHNNIVQIFDYGKVENTYFLSMDYIDGQDLRSLINRVSDQGEPFELGCALRIVDQVARGLDFAHRKTDLEGNPMSIIHRDISPQNILLSFEGEVKITDFGLAKTCEPQKFPQVSEAGQLKGKYAYMSPEQTRGEDLDGRSDLFSLAIVAYELITGVRPFRGTTVVELLTQIQDGDCQLPSEVLPELPADFDVFFSRALAPDKEDRFSNARAFMIALEALKSRHELTVDIMELAAYLNRFDSQGPSTYNTFAQEQTLISDEPISVESTGDKLPEINNAGLSEDLTLVPPVEIELTETAAAVSIIPEVVTDLQNKDKTKTKSKKSRFFVWRLAALLVLFVISGVVWIGELTQPALWVMDVRGTPGAEVRIDGILRGVTPVRVNDLEGGRSIRVDVRKKGYKPYGITLRLAEHDGYQRLEPHLKPRLSNLRLRSVPLGAQVYSNGVLIEEVTPTELKEQKEGTYELSFSLEGYELFYKEIILEAGVSRTINAELVPLYSEIHVATVPPGARIILFELDFSSVPDLKIYNLFRYLQEKKIKLKKHRFCTAPCSFGNLESGSVLLMAEQMDCKSEYRLANLETGQVYNIKFRLQEKEKIRKPRIVKLRCIDGGIFSSGGRELSGAVRLSESSREQNVKWTDGDISVQFRVLVSHGSTVLSVRPKPWAVFSMDNKKGGKTPVVNLKFKGGRHQLKLQIPNRNNKILHFRFE